MAMDQRTSVIHSELLKRIFENLVNKSRRHASSRQSRKKPDAFRSLLRHMSEVTYDSTWEVIRPLVANSEEYKALEDEERIVVFDKVIRRLKEKRDDEKRYREREGKRERDESTHRESKSRRRYEERSRERSHPRSRERRDSRENRDRSKETYREGRERGSKRRSDEDLRPGDRKVTIS